MNIQVADWTEFAESGSGRLLGRTAVTVGVFDGVHRGHQALIEKIVRHGAEPAVITFRRSPKQVLYPDTAGAAILSLRQKLRIFEELGVSHTILIDFSEHFSKLRGRDFIEILIRQGAVSYLAVGSNFRCGFGLDTDAALIKTRYETAEIRIEVVPPVRDATGPISSSRIRAAITAGDLKSAAAALGRNVALDLRGFKTFREGGGTAFHPIGRAVPPDGRYSVMVNGKTSGKNKGKEAEITIKHGNVCIPPDFEGNFDAVTDIEFISVF
ncbi:MAG: FAD synthetase family protein [Spirochaetaceae bacterium]|nr:FAD synthetase family protein [Spirochaetaceae bacterium]